MFLNCQMYDVVLVSFMMIMFYIIHYSNTSDRGISLVTGEMVIS